MENRCAGVRRLIMTALVAMVAMPQGARVLNGDGPGYGGDCRAGDHHDDRGSCVRTEYVVVTTPTATS